MKQLIVGILAHVDAGKTTLSEALLFQSGQLRKLGRVDHQDAFLDTFALERARGITIFSKQATLPLSGGTMTLLDTPGHMDFSAEMERTLQVLDYAIVVISGSDGIQAHTRTLWRLLETYNVPVFFFINKMDLDGTDRPALMQQLLKGLDARCVDFGRGAPQDEFFESIAMCDEAVLGSYLETGMVSDSDIASLVASRKLFPCYFGSALKLSGVDDLLAGLARYTKAPDYPAAFGARVYKIARDTQGIRLTYLKVTGGVLRVKDVLTNRLPDIDEEQVWEEKADQLRIYSGSKYEAVEQVEAGGVCAVVGLGHSFAGQGLGYEEGGERPLLRPVLTYRVMLPPGYSVHTALAQMRLLEEEDPQLHVAWSAQLREIHVQIMGEIQLEILKELFKERFGIEVQFDTGSILYRETIANTVEGVGHFEPLRHYAEVHLLLESGEQGSGLKFSSNCSENQLDINWQRLILTHLAERRHRGVLTGAPITDMSITLVAGRGHLKHTEGGDFREATYRAVRQGLMQAQSVLLEPWYDFRLELPSAQIGRAMSDLQQMYGTINNPKIEAETAVLTGSAPVSTMRDYSTVVTAYTRGLGQLSCTFKGYLPCHNSQQVIAARGYNPERDISQTADSVFCSHGAGFAVKWDQVKAHMHIESVLRPKAPPQPERSPTVRPRPSVQALDKELMEIFERTYGKIKPQALRPTPKQVPAPQQRMRSLPDASREAEYLLVDGYNIIFAWDMLSELARDSLDAARHLLMDMLSRYQDYKQNHVILVFDAYNVPREQADVQRYNNIHVVYTKVAETADSYIEKASYQLSKQHRVRVATSDYMQQLIIMGHGSLRISAMEFLEEVEQASGQISEILRKYNQNPKSSAIRDAMEKAQQEYKDDPSDD